MESSRLLLVSACIAPFGVRRDQPQSASDDSKLTIFCQAQKMPCKKGVFGA